MKGRIVIGSDPHNISVVEDLVRLVSDEIELGMETVFNLRLVLSEAIHNAILHGNEGHVEKEVLIDYELRGNRLYCCISDEGTGFDVGRVKDPTSIANREYEGGRGVFFLQQFTDHFHYCGDSRGVKFSMKLS